MCVSENRRFFIELKTNKQKMKKKRNETRHINIFLELIENEDNTQNDMASTCSLNLPSSTY